MPPKPKKGKSYQIKVIHVAESKSDRLPKAEAFFEINNRLSTIERLLTSDEMNDKLHKEFKEFEREMQAAVNQMPPMLIKVAQAMKDHLFQTPGYEKTYTAEVVSNVKINLHGLYKEERKTPKGKKKKITDIVDSLLEGAPENGIMVEVTVSMAQAMSTQLVQDFKREVMRRHLKFFAEHNK